MYVHSVKLINFKSIGNYPESEIILEPKVTAVIGKNESGKSNVLDGLSRINFLKSNSVAFSTGIVNRNCDTGTENAYIIVLKPDENEIKNGLCMDTRVEISKNGCVVTGGFFDYYKKCGLLASMAVANFLNQVGTNPFQLSIQELTSYKKHRSELLRDNSIDMYQHMAALEYFHAKINNIATEYRDEYKNILQEARERWFSLLTMFPVFYYRKSDRHLNTMYKFEEVEKELKGSSVASNSLLYDFVKFVGVSVEDFLEAVRVGTTARQESLRRRINKLIEEKVNKPFRDFYQTEKITLDLGFNAGSISFVVQSEEGEALMLSERSTGLKWYLETFIDMHANNINERNIVYLLDEPGISLHVNAQRELLQLFRHLAERGNQVVYTTHSPYMLDMEMDGIHRIRAVVKNAEGYTYIYKTAYDSRIAPESQKDTMAPVISAIGMNLNDTFGPAKDKINIVTEGMSDYIYLCMMAKELDIDMKNYSIIPSVGASNCINICSILHGWGCKCIALFDYDNEGVNKGGEYLREKMFFQYKQQYCYLTDVEQSDVDSKTYKETPYVIEDVVTREEISRFCSENNVAESFSKTLLAKLMSDSVESGSYHLGETCKENFKALFERMFSYFV